MHGYKLLSPLRGYNLLSPLNGYALLSSMHGYKLLSPMRGYKLLSPLHGYKQHSSMHGYKLLSPMHGSHVVGQFLSPHIRYFVTHNSSAWPPCKYCPHLSSRSGAVVVGGAIISLVLIKLNIVHVRKVTSQVGLCSRHKLICDDNFHVYGSFCFK
ncbi:hypothetical protein DPMN_023066 [Dreissena polymorpha]|uniref:Uncharacterized protein n=1 Tax=Dreissena polymorpha TaxID=45954 RepID=A0A9D4RBF1_DREPO|nr:hypothetical protein DPMN_023066 [Dreissena polymorpha]